MLSALPGGPLNKDKLCRARDKSPEKGHSGRGSKRERERKKKGDGNLTCTEGMNEPAQQGDYASVQQEPS